MAVNLPEPSGVLTVPGVRLGTGAAAIKRAGRDDLVLFVFDPGTRVAGVFTRSAFRAAPVILADANIRRGDVRALLINSGNANAATGDQGIEDARALCTVLAEALDLPAEAIAPFSTGVIGERLPVSRMAPVVRELPGSLDADNWLKAGRAIMTTDTVAKVRSCRGSVGGREVTVSGMAKGAGMIRPDMATMLAFVCTDAAVGRDCLQALLYKAVNKSFNRITVDGDTSTNDSLILAATGAAGGEAIDDAASTEARALFELILPVCMELAQAIVRDGEGATKFVTVRVTGGRDEGECLKAAYTIAESPLVKTALFASDPNWGRLAMAVGRAGIDGLDPAKVQIWFDDVKVMTGGLKDAGYTEAAGAGVLAQSEFEIRVDLGRGDAESVVWTSDFSYDYVKINAEYRT
ncbi:MAG: bifunctional glutamate N-acetyltransferase/amino-acid acetyltransferase ArgJ [Pseudomonadales bacterium]